MSVSLGSYLSSPVLLSFPSLLLMLLPAGPTLVSVPGTCHGAAKCSVNHPGSRKVHQRTLMTAVCRALLGYPRRHQALQEAGLLTSAFVPGPSSPTGSDSPALVVERAIGEPCGEGSEAAPWGPEACPWLQRRVFPLASPAPKAPPGPVGPGFLVFPRPSCRNCG